MKSNRVFSIKLFKVNINIGFEIIAQQHKDWIVSICERVNEKYKK